MCLRPRSTDTTNPIVIFTLNLVDGEFYKIIVIAVTDHPVLSSLEMIGRASREYVSAAPKRGDLTAGMW
jgi:hypothetical protein